MKQCLEVFASNLLKTKYFDISEAMNKHMDTFLTISKRPGNQLYHATVICSGGDAYELDD